MAELGFSPWLLPLAFVPGFLWLGYFYRKDIYNPKPISWVLGAFFLGAVMVLPSAALEFVLLEFWALFVPRSSEAYLILTFFANVGPVEEIAKFIVVYFWVYRALYFNEPIDGIIYASAVALGFASAENLIYMWQAGWQIIFLRGLLTTCAHVLFASIWGMALGHARFAAHGSRRIIAQGLILSILFHAAYDYILAISTLSGILVIFVLMGWMWYRIHRWIDWAVSISPSAPPLAFVSVPLPLPVEQNQRHLFDEPDY